MIDFILSVGVGFIRRSSTGSFGLRAAELVAR